jgi:hypothetical protein
MGRTTALRQAIKRDFVPYLRDKGFDTDLRHAPQYPAFRKIDSEDVYACAIQWEKYGRPRFSLHFAKCGGEGVTVRGQHVLPADIFPFHIAESGFLNPGQGPGTAAWFRQDRPWLIRLFSASKVYPAERVVAQLIVLFGEVEEYWKSGSVGPHIRLLPVPRP